MPAKKQVLFVDDEPKILDGIRRMLRSMCQKQDMSFATNGPEALEILEKEPFEVLVTDIRMPCMEGAELLSEVKKLYPQMVRIVLSGQVSKKNATFYWPDASVSEKNHVTRIY